MAGVDSPTGAKWVLGMGMLAASAWWVWLGSKRWFHADDWNYLLERDVLQGDGSLASRLFESQNGHPVAIPALQFSITSWLFDWESYAPFVATGIVLHLVCGGLLWLLLRRSDVTDLTASVVTVLVLLLGPATEFPTFASISNFQYSLVALLATMLILDRHDDGSWAIVGVAVLGAATILSSSFGPVFAVAVALATLPQRRWRAAATILVPQLAIFAWWWVAWGRHETTRSGSVWDAPEWAVIVTHRLFGALAGPGFGPFLLLATAVWGVAMCRPGRARATIVWPLAATAGVGMILVGVQRSDLGTEDVAIGRYVVVFAFLLAPAVSQVVDRAREVDRRVYAVVLALACVAIVVNSTNWRRGQLAISDATTFERSMLELLAGAEPMDAPPGRQPSWCSPEITLGDLPLLVERGAITPRTAITPDERALLALVLGDVETPPADDPRPCASAGG